MPQLTQGTFRVADVSTENQLIMFLSVSSSSILFSKTVPVTCLMHTWPVVSSLFIQVTMKVSIYYCNTFFFCVCVELFLHINIYIYMCMMAWMQQLPKIFDLMLDMLSGGWTSVEALFLCDLKGVAAAVSCEPECQFFTEHLKTPSQLDLSIQQQFFLTILSSFKLFNCHLEKKK